MVASIKARSPAIQIGILLQTTAREDDPLRWRLHSQLIRECLRFVNNPADPAVTVLPAYFHLTPELGWPTPADVVNAETHLTSAHVGDTIHFDDPNRSMAAALISNWIGCTL